MPTGGASRVQWTPDMYWQVREREIKKVLTRLREAVESCEQARRVLLAVSETAKLNSDEWDTAQSAAMHSLRTARFAKTQLRKMVANARDTIRIRPEYAQALTERTSETLDTASKLCEYLDAHGF